MIPFETLLHTLNLLRTLPNFAYPSEQLPAARGLSYSQLVALW